MNKTEHNYKMLLSVDVICDLDFFNQVMIVGFTGAVRHKFSNEEYYKFIKEVVLK